MKKSAVFSFAVGGIVLLAGLALVFLEGQPAPQRTFEGEVQDLLPNPDQIPGWTIEHQPIADTPELRAKVDQELNYDDAIFAVYTKGNQRISVYVAYWSPGKMPHRLVATHTPDVCWVGAGWRATESSSHLSLEVGGPVKTLKPCESRVMELNGNTEHVLFWHLLDGTPMSYGTRGLPPWYATFADLFTRKLSQRPEQFFIRISSNQPFERWQGTDLFKQLVNRLPVIQPIDG